MHQANFATQLTATDSLSHFYRFTFTCHQLFLFSSLRLNLTHSHVGVGDNKLYFNLRKCKAIRLSRSITPGQPSYELSSHRECGQDRECSATSGELAKSSPTPIRCVLSITHLIGLTLTMPALYGVHTTVFILIRLRLYKGSPPYCQRCKLFDLNVLYIRRDLFATFYALNSVSVHQ
jgi:hypothetical protein